jgi:flagellar basal body-associated protein FliL
MTKPTPRKKRNKLTTVLLAPILIIVFIVGWSLYWIGQSGQRNTKQPQKPINKTPPKQDNVELIVISPKEQQILAN